MKPSILSRYIFKETLSYFAISLFAFTTVLLTLNMLRFASLIINRGVNWSDIAMVFIAIVPTFLEIAIPMATLLGVMLAFARLSGDSELIVMRASGVSLLQLIWPVLTVGIVVGLVSLSVSHVARPWGYKTLSQTLFHIASSRSTAGLEGGVFTTLGDLTIYAEKIDHLSGALEGVLIDDRREKDRRQVIAAQRGTLLSDESAQTVEFNLRDGTIHQKDGEKYSTTEFVVNRISIEPQDLYSDEIARKGKQFNSMSLAELAAARVSYLAILQRIRAGEELVPEMVEAPFGQRISQEQLTTKEMKKRINRSSLEEGRRTSMPYAAFVLALIGMALGVQPPRTQKTWGIGVSAVFGMLVFVVYYGVLSIGIALGESGKLPTSLALWLPNIVVSVAGAGILYMLGVERWHSVNHAIDGGILRLRQLRGRKETSS